MSNPTIFFGNCQEKFTIKVISLDYIFNINKLSNYFYFFLDKSSEIWYISNRKLVGVSDRGIYLMRTYIKRSTGRRIISYIKDEKEITQAYPRYLIEQKIGRKLNTHEVVHHIDGNKTNDVLENLILLSFEKHALFHTLKDRGIVVSFQKED